MSALQASGGSRYSPALTAEMARVDTTEPRGLQGSGRLRSAACSVRSNPVGDRDRKGGWWAERCCRSGGRQGSCVRKDGTVPSRNLGGQAVPSRATTTTERPSTRRTIFFTSANSSDSSLGGQQPAPTPCCLRGRAAWASQILCVLRKAAVNREQCVPLVTRETELLTCLPSSYPIAPIVPQMWSAT